MLLKDIEEHLKRTGQTPSSFGSAAIGDPCLVFDLRKGRELRSRTTARVRAYLERSQ